MLLLVAVVAWQYRKIRVLRRRLKNITRETSLKRRREEKEEDDDDDENDEDGDKKKALNSLKQELPK